jgi:hypothetical protein
MTTTKKAAMYAQIEQHGNNLNAIFNTPYDAITLSKKLRRLEMKAHKIAVDWCNGENGIDSDNIDTHTAPIIEAVKKILFARSWNVQKERSIIFNGDARGYALKISDKYVREKKLQIYTDMGGYGILSPDFSNY